MKHDVFEYIFKRERIIDRMTNFQIGLMFEYVFHKHHSIGIGFMTGATESKFTTYINDPKVPLIYVTNSNSGKYMKQGLEYTYTFHAGDIQHGKHKLLSRFNMSLLAGMFLINNQITNYTPTITSIYQDSQMNTIDSVTSPSTTLRDRGFMVSGGIRLAYLSRKQKEKLSITFLYDHGFNNLVLFESHVYFNYLNNYLIGQQISNGSQIKLYLSFPINLYTFKHGKVVKANN
jgi:hypothetical protein